MCSAFQIIMLTWLSFVAMFVATCFVVHFTHAFQVVPLLPTATTRSSLSSSPPGPGPPATAFFAAANQRQRSSSGTGTQLWVATMNKASLLASQSPDDDDGGGAAKQQQVKQVAATTATATQTKKEKAATSELLPPAQQATTRPTLSSYLEGAASEDQELLAQDMKPILLALEKAFRQIAVIVKRAALDGNTGYATSSAAAGDGTTTTNVQGEQQKKLDLVTNDILKMALAESGGMVASMISEEEEHEIAVAEVAGGSGGAKYVVAFDPLDGSSNTDTNVPIGSIFAVYQGEGNNNGILGNQPLRETLVCAGYCLYSSATSFVFGYGKRPSPTSDDGQSSNSGVQGFTFDDSADEFVLTHPNVKVPTRGSTYSFNEANRHSGWHPALTSYLEDVQQGHGESGRKSSLRYIGSMVGDIHRTALAGGVFGYPADAKNPNGKLRLLYEVAPMSYLLEMAGGLGLAFSDDNWNGGKAAVAMGQRVLDIVPRSIHERCPVVMGSRDDLLELQKRYFCYHEEEGKYNQEDEPEDDAEDATAEVVSDDEDKYYAYSGQGERIPLTLQEYLKRLEAWF